ncbi:MAG: 3-mercaptopyruvate sulfurtransferase [Alphaproteobacteria bacterium]|nr:3-mercaptopyruvate sulfurtransferase [Alphaproteobacteria bacterium]
MTTDATAERPDSLVSTAWLSDRLAHPDVIILDASWYLPAQNRNAKAEYAARRIPGARFFDIDAIADLSTPLPHMLPSERDFAAAATSFGIGNADQVVVYDGAGLLSAARVWWMFKTFGHPLVAVLDGGFLKWQAEGRPIETKPAAGVTGSNKPAFIARLDRGKVRSVAEMKVNLGGRREQVLDARSRGRFAAQEPEPRAGLRGGHVPGSLNLPYGELLDSNTKTVLPPAQLKEVFVRAGIDLARPVITSCGSGITAAVLTLGLALIGHRENALYDGAWAEWGSRTDTPVER